MFNICPTFLIFDWYTSIFNKYITHVHHMSSLIDPCSECHICSPYVISEWDNIHYMSPMFIIYYLFTSNSHIFTTCHICSTYVTSGCNMFTPSHLCPLCVTYVHHILSHVEICLWYVIIVWHMFTIYYICSLYITYFPYVNSHSFILIIYCLCTENVISGWHIFTYVHYISPNFTICQFRWRKYSPYVCDVHHLLYLV